jgi:hypothetical protein
LCFICFGDGVGIIDWKNGPGSNAGQKINLLTEGVLAFCYRTKPPTGSGLKRLSSEIEIKELQPRNIPLIIVSVSGKGFHRLLECPKPITDADFQKGWVIFLPD